MDVLWTFYYKLEDIMENACLMISIQPELVPLSLETKRDDILVYNPLD